MSKFLSKRSEVLLTKNGEVGGRCKRSLRILCLLWTTSILSTRVLGVFQISFYPFFPFSVNKPENYIHSKWFTARKGLLKYPAPHPGTRSQYLPLPRDYGQAGGTHPTGMHSCSKYFSVVSVSPQNVGWPLCRASFPEFFNMQGLIFNWSVVLLPLFSL